MKFVKSVLSIALKQAISAALCVERGLAPGLEDVRRKETLLIRQENWRWQTLLYRNNLNVICIMVCV